MLRFLLEKEFKQFARNSFLPKLVIMFPIMIMVVLPWVATMDISGVSLSVVDKDNSSLSKRLIRKIEASKYFSICNISSSHTKAINDMEYGKSDIILELPNDFSNKINRGESVQVLVLANSVNGTKGSLGSNYLSSIISGFASELAAENGYTNSSGANLSVYNLYNPTLNYRQFMIPSFMVIIILMLCGFLPALNIVSEKEKGTIEQINVTPVGKFQFIMAKLIPYWIIGFVVVSICFLLSWIIYGFIPLGSFVVIYAAVAVFVLVMSSFGLIVSNYSQTMQQSMMVMFFFVLVFNLMSGLFTPVRSMPDWAQWIAALSPPRYFVDIMRGVYQKGCSFADLWTQFAWLLAFAVVLGAFAIFSYRKRA